MVSRAYVRRTPPPHTVIVAGRDNKDYIRVLLYSYYSAITGWGVLLKHMRVRISCLQNMRGAPGSDLRYDLCQSQQTNHST